MDVTFGTDFGAAAGLFVEAAASVGATGRFAAVEGTDVGFTAAVGRAAFGAVAEPATGAGVAAVPAADAAEPVLAGVGLGFVGAAAARGAPLAGMGCDGAGFGVVAEGRADVGAVAGGVADAGDE